MKYLLLSLLALTACGKKNDYVYPKTSFSTSAYSETHAIIAEGSKVDILWVIDNSGSMDPIQQNVIDNSYKFMEEFLKKNLDWKMGLISTDIYESPYLGFVTPFTNKTPDSLNVFKNAVSRLGTSGSGTEKEFEPIISHLSKYPTFLRPKTHLIVIMVTDEEEQSSISAADFLKTMIAMKGNPQLFKVYAALQAADFGCPQYSTSSTLNYAGSPFEAAVKGTNGKVYSTCTPDFGTKLADLSRDIISTVSSPTILLKARPIPSTITIYYKDTYLQGGDLEDKGLWTYDPENNAIRFHNLDFVDFDFKNIEITFDVDRGIPI